LPSMAEDTTPARKSSAPKTLSGNEGTCSAATTTA
jgi:hypothetical protein